MRHALWFLLFCSFSALAQNVSGTLSGSVQDSANAVIPGVDVTLTEEATGFVRTTKTNRTGFFSFPDVIAGTYRLSITAPGFKRYLQNGIQVNSGDQRALGNIVLVLGEVTESVTVTADSAPVQLGSSEKAGVLTGTDIGNMALRGRDFFDAVGLVLGVTDTSDNRESPSPNSIRNLSVLGGRSESKSFTIDGVSSLQTGGQTSVHFVPSMDSIAELKVLVSNYAAEYGRNSGGGISVITRGGTKEFHASGGWYHRHESFAANDFFNNRNGQPRPRYRYNIASYTASGPIYIPYRFNTERSRLFFFWSQEFQHQVITNAARTVRVPTELERAGDFSRSYDVNGRVATIYDPFANRTPFPGNVIPPSRFSAIGVNILKFFPLPNFVDPLPSRLYQWNFISQASSPYPRGSQTARIDYSPRANVQMYLRVGHNSDAGTTWYLNSNYPVVQVDQPNPGQGLALHTVTTISPTVFNEFIFGWSGKRRRYYPHTIESVSRKATGIEIAQWYPRNNPEGLIPDMSFGGVSNAASANMPALFPSYNANDVFTFVENISRVSGRHTSKVGVYVERARNVESSLSTPTRGSVAFGSDTSNPLNTGHAYANALLGVFSSYSEATSRPEGQFRLTTLESYVQDSWRVRPGLTLEYGLRFYHHPAWGEIRKLISAFIPALYDPAKAPVLLRPGYDQSRVKVAIDPLSGKTYSAVMIGTFVPGIGDPANGMRVIGFDGRNTLSHTPALCLAPRLGFAWDPFGRGRTAVRVGGGVYYDTISAEGAISALPNPPQTYAPTLYYSTLEQLGTTAGQAVLAPGGTVASAYGDQPVGVTYNFSFGIQQQLRRDMLVDISYAGSISRHLMWRRNINAVPVGARFLDLHPENKDPTTTSALATNFLRPYQGYADIIPLEFGGTSSYNALLVGFKRPMAHGIQADFSYGFSKALGTGSVYNFRVSTVLPPRSRNYGPLDYDICHQVSLRYTWILPKPGRNYGLKALGVVTDGWELSGISRFRTGTPFTPGLALVDNADITGTPSESARPMVLDPAAPLVDRFGRPPRGSLGNAGANVLRYPGINNWDISLYRKVQVTERLAAQLRLETYNTFNHTQFSTVSTTPKFSVEGRQVDPLFLQPTTARSARRVQLAVRLNW